MSKENTNPVVKHLGENIKHWRQKKGISQDELARQADLKLSNLAKLEGGFNFNPTLTTLLAVAHVLTDDSLDKLLKIIRKPSG